MFGELTDVYIPKPFRGFGFVTFASSDSVKRVMGSNHVVNDAQLNMTFAEPKGGRDDHHSMRNFHARGSSVRSPAISQFAVMSQRSGGRYGDRTGGSMTWKSGSLNDAFNQ